MGGLVLVDYGCGNLHSVQRRLHLLGADVVISGSPAVIAGASKLVLPGVGHFGKAMANLSHNKMLEAIRDAALCREIPVLGICLGMQLMARHSQEGDCAGLGLIDGEVVALQVPDQGNFKVPHTGWNQVSKRGEGRLLRGISDEEEFYFLHSFYVRPDEPAVVVGETQYGQSFCSAIEQRNLFGVQFHPEKSHDAGEALLRNFVEI